MNHFQRSVALHLGYEMRDIKRCLQSGSDVKEQVNAAAPYVYALHADLASEGVPFSFEALNGEKMTPDYFTDVQHMQEFMKGVYQHDPVIEHLVNNSPRDLEEMMAGFTPESCHPEVDFGPPVGREIV